MSKVVHAQKENNVSCIRREIDQIQQKALFAKEIGQGLHSYLFHYTGPSAKKEEKIGETISQGVFPDIYKQLKEINSLLNEVLLATVQISQGVGHTLPEKFRNMNTKASVEEFEDSMEDFDEDEEEEEPGPKLGKKFKKSA